MFPPHNFTSTAPDPALGWKFPLAHAVSGADSGVLPIVEVPIPRATVLNEACFTALITVIELFF